MSTNNLSLLNPWIGTIAIIVVVLISVIIQLISNRWFSDDDFDRIQNVGGIYMTAVGTLYSVVLGMMLVDASDDFSNARKCIEKESSALIKAYAISSEMPDGYRSKMVLSISEYTNYITTFEWNKMPHNEIREETRSMITKIWYSIKNVEPETEYQKALYPLLLQSYDDVLENRNGMMSYSNYTLTWIEWFCLSAGGALMIVFTLFFSVRNKVAHAVMTGMVAFMVSINLYAVYILSNPYSGFMEIPTENLKVLSAYIKEAKDREARKHE